MLTPIVSSDRLEELEIELGTPGYKVSLFSSNRLEELGIEFGIPGYKVGGLSTILWWLLLSHLTD